MSAKKPESPKKTRAHKKKKGGRKGPWLKLLGVALLILILGGGYLIARNYHLQSVAEGLETIVGELDQENVTLRAADPQSAQALIDKIKALADSSWGSLKVGAPEAGEGSVGIDATLSGRTYRIEIRWDPARAPKTEARPAKPERRTEAPVKGAKLAIVIDDMGGDLDMARALFDLPYPITPAILPHLTHSTEVARMAFAINRPHLLHMPMEPRDYPKNNPGKGAILKTDAPEKITEKLGAALDSVPGASGINNHMGSRATELPGAMEAVMAELHKRDLFFLDSGTSAVTVGAKTARDAGLKWAKRDVFLDNVADKDAITAKLKETLALAKKTGSAIAIGHGRPETLKALQTWGKTAEEEGVRIVPVTELLHDKALETN